MHSLARTLRRQLLSRGFTALPVCRACRFERPPRDFGESGVCLYCEQQADFAAAKEEARTGQHTPPVGDMVPLDDGRDFE